MFEGRCVRNFTLSVNCLCLRHSTYWAGIPALQISLFRVGSDGSQKRGIFFSRKSRHVTCGRIGCYSMVIPPHCIFCERVSGWRVCVVCERERTRERKRALLR